VCLVRFLSYSLICLVRVVFFLPFPLLINNLGRPAFKIHFCLFTFVAVALIVSDHPIGITREQELVVLRELDTGNTGTMVINYMNRTCLL